MKRTRADLALAAVTVIWGTTFVVVKSVLADISPFLFLALRFSLAALALGLIYRQVIFGKRFTAKSLRPGVLAGSLLFVAYVFQTLGLQLTTPSKSAFLTGLAIPMVPLASSIVYKDRPGYWEVAGILIASFGMILMTLPSSVTSGFEMGRGDFLSFLCAVTFALHIVVIGHYSPLMGFEPLAVSQIGTAAALGVFSVWFAEPVRFHATPAMVGGVLFCGLMATALTFTTQAWAQQYTSASRAAVIFALEPVVAWATSWLMTGETLDGRGKAGAGLILAGILLVELKRTRADEHQIERGRRFGIIQSNRGT
jgi:drug/metabolite transporter (DMT)-like permease